MDYIRELDRRNSQRRNSETMCAVCDRVIGVAVLKFKSNDNAKVSRHKGHNGLWCAGSGLSVPLSLVMTRSGQQPRAWGIDPHA